MKISVVMPVYNVEKYINSAIKSVLNQSFTDFELIIIDDGSTDNTVKLIKEYKDKRIKIWQNKKNLGLVPSLNKGIKKAKGEFIVRCDGDDINEKRRFQIQVEFLDKNPDYCLAGSGARLIDEAGKKLGYEIYTEKDSGIKRNLLIRNSLIHGSVIMRTKDVRKIGGYRMKFNKGAEDYDLWMRLSRFGKFYNIPKQLLRRRVYRNSYSRANHYRVEFMAFLVRLNNLPRGISSFFGI